MFPDIRVKQLSTMVPGEIFRFRFRGTMPKGIMVECSTLQIPSGLVIVMLDDIPQLQGCLLGFYPVTNDMIGEDGMSYGSNPLLIVPPGAEVASSSDERTSTSGTLVVRRGVRAIRSLGFHASLSEIPIFIDIDTWTAIPHVPYSSTSFTILEWELRLPTDIELKPPLPPIFTFSAGR